MVHFSNAIVCAGDQDLTPYEHELWKENTCVTAFDGVAPDQPVNWTAWYHNLISYSADIRRERYSKIQAQGRRLRELEAEVAVLKEPHEDPVEADQP